MVTPKIALIVILSLIQIPLPETATSGAALNLENNSVQTQAIIPRTLWMRQEDKASPSFRLHRQAEEAGLWRDPGMTGLKSSMAETEDYIRKLRRKFLLVPILRIVGVENPLIDPIVQFFEQAVRSPFVARLYKGMAERSDALGTSRKNLTPGLYHMTSFGNKPPVPGFSDDDGIYGDSPEVLIHEFIAFWGLPHKAGIAFEMLFLTWQRSPGSIEILLKQLDLEYQARLRQRGIDNVMTLEAVYRRSLARIHNHYREYNGRREDLLSKMGQFEKSTPRPFGFKPAVRLFRRILRLSKKARHSTIELSGDLLKKLKGSKKTMTSLTIERSIFEDPVLLDSGASVIRHFPQVYSWLREEAETGTAQHMVFRWDGIGIHAEYVRKIANTGKARPHRWSLSIMPYDQLARAVIDKAWIFTRQEVLVSKGQRDPAFDRFGRRAS